MNALISAGEKNEYSAVTKMGTSMIAANSISTKRVTAMLAWGVPLEMRFFIVTPPQVNVFINRFWDINKSPNSKNTMMAKL